jgi:hypothetical protein
MPVPETDMAAGLPNPSFEKGTDGWSLPSGAVDHTVAHSGNASVQLQAVPGGHAVAATSQIALLPEESYRVKLWARTETQGARLNINFYAGPEYDFRHVVVELDADGQWHEYEMTVPTGQFPVTVRPALRVWVYHHPGPVWIDDLALEAKKQPVAEGKPMLVETLLP